MPRHFLKNHYNNSSDHWTDWIGGGRQMKLMAGVSLRTRLTLRYGLALAVVAMLTLAGYGLMRHAVGTEVLGSKLLNVAGRQRMLCQRVEILAVRAQREAGAERHA